MYINWLPDYEVEVAEIDEQHKKFVLLINDLYDTVEVGSEEIILGDILDQLAAYANYHFATEEKYFDKFDYPDSASHKGVHQKFRDTVADFQQNYVGQEDEYAMKVMDFMKSWLTNHIITVDKAYADCFHDHGLN